MASVRPSARERWFLLDWGSGGNVARSLLRQRRRMREGVIVGGKKLACAR
jgi:hypothetical protein